jgi:CubicO group peptidase (beta-lactamase class C family)
LKKIALISLAVFILFGTLMGLYSYHLWHTFNDIDRFPVSAGMTTVEFADEIAIAQDRLIRARDSLNIPSISAAVGLGGELIWGSAVGYTNLKNHEPATPETIYRLGSTSKAVTASLIMRFASEGLIRLDEPINRLIPQLPADRPMITWRQLLSHTAGFGNYGDFGLKSAFYTICNCIQFDNVDEALRLFIDSPLLFEPGEDFEYSSFDVIAASKAVESVTGRPFLESLEHYLFTPLEMNHTFGDHAPDIEGNEAVFYELHQNRFRKWRSLNLSSHKVNLSYKWAGGGLISTPSDMVKMGNALLADSTFINRTIRDDFWEPVVLANGKVNEQQYASGWRSYKSYATEHLLGEDTGVWMVHHGGVSKGSMNLLALFPEYELVINVSVNGREDEIDFTPFWFEVMKIARPFLLKAEEEKYGL